jgi:hypothetical protein
VPHHIAYDNLRAAVRKILVGSDRALSARFEALGAHYVFESSFCQPRTGDEKCGVEAQGKTIRWQHLVPIPVGDQTVRDQATLMARLDANCATKTRRRQRHRRALCRMLPLPERSFRRGALVRLRARSTRPWPKCCPWTALNRLTPGRVSRHSAPEKAT